MKALGMLQKWNNGNYPSKQEISEAIAELKALENRSCNNCEYALKLHSDLNITHSEFVCKIDSRYNNKDFYCNKWKRQNETN